MTEQVPSTKELNPFDADMERLEEIRATVRLAASTTDVVFLLSFIDKLWNEYTRTLQQLDDAKYGPLFEFPTRRETEKAIAAMLPICDCEGPQKIGPGYHAPYCSAHPWCPNCGGKDGEHKPGCQDGSEVL